MREIGERLAARARQLGLADAEVARRLGLTQSRYSNYVNGVREPDFQTFARICRELGMTPNQLLDFDVAPSAASLKERDRIVALLDALGPRELNLAVGFLKLLTSQREPPDEQVRKVRQGDTRTAKAARQSVRKT